MQFCSRENLAAMLCQDVPEGEGLKEMQLMAEAILTDSKASHFLYSNDENGDDPKVSYEDFQLESSDVLPVRDDGDLGYFGVVRQSHKFNDTAPRVYGCYLGGSPLSSAPGFAVSELYPEFVPE